MRKNDWLTYNTGTATVRAIVRTAHKDGSVTVEPAFFQKPDGTDAPGWIGGKVRLDPAECRPL